MSHEKARKVYDRIGSFQDSQAFYEDGAISLLVQNGRFDEAESLFEFGCGTGRFAHYLFENVLSKTAVYRGYDISPKMVGLATERLKPFSNRATVVLSDGGPPSAEPDCAYDRFVSNYVFDLLPDEDTDLVLNEAHRIVCQSGLLCLSGLSTGTGLPSKFVAGAIGLVQRATPALTGGCRPVDLLPFLDKEAWNEVFHEKVVSFCITSETLIARRI